MTQNRIASIALSLALLGATAATTSAAAPSIPMIVTDGLALWLDAAQLTGLTDGALVNTWTDMSGKNNHAVLMGGLPKYQSNQLNSKPVVRFAHGDCIYLRVGKFFVSWPGARRYFDSGLVGIVV